MKILQVITSLQIGGAEKLISEISPLLRDKGHEVDVLAFDGVETHFKRSLEEAGIKVYSFSKNCNVYNPLFILKLVKMMRNYDIVHTHNTAPQLFAAIGSVVCSVVLVTTEHTTSNRRRDWKWYTPIDRWMYKRYNKVICISNQAEENLKAFHPSLKNVCTIYNGVDVQKFHDAKPLECIRSEKTTVVMVAVGDGERRPELEYLIKELNLESTVKLMGIRADIPEVLQSADIVVMSSHFEGLSLSNVEGMSVGKPFIASDVDGLREVVSGYGQLFSHEDDKELASIIKRLAEDKDFYKQVADKCWERAQMYDIKKMVDSYSDLFVSLKGI